MISLKQAVDMAVRGIPPDEATQSIEVDNHNFYVRPIGNKNLLEDGETSYFRHQHIGKDDRVFYSVNVKSKNSYEAKITRIQFRGPFNSGIKKLNVFVGGALKETGLNGVIASKVLSVVAGLKLGKIIDGDWVPAAAKVVDAIGERMAADAN